jgi:hypothetical protein
VTLVEIDWINKWDFSFRDAIVIGQGKHRDECFANARANGRDRYRAIGFFWTGKVKALPRFFS